MSINEFDFLNIKRCLSKTCWGEKIISCLITFEIMQKQPPKKFYIKKLFLTILQYLQENICVGDSFSFRILWIYLKHLFWRTSANGCFWKCSWNREKLKIDKGSPLKNRIFQHIIWNKWECISLCLHFMIGFHIYILYFFDVARNKLQTINMIRVDKKRSKVQEKNMP